MDKPLEQSKRISRRKGKADMKVGTVKHRATKTSITRDQFHTLVRKAAQPIKKPSESDVASTETSEPHPSDDYSEKNTH